MKIRWWGVRGSIPVPSKETVIFGGNTSCVSLETDRHTLIFDAGTGIRDCGNYLMNRGGSSEFAIFMSHTHWDHIQGFPFFVPSYIPGNKIDMYGPPSDIRERNLQQIMELQTNFEYFPIRVEELGAEITYFDCREMRFKLQGDLEIQACRMNHPVATLSYRVNYKEKSFIYGGDHEPFRNLYRGTSDSGDMDEEFLKELDANAEEQNSKVVDFCRNADLVSWDSQYTKEEYQTKIGWGHSFYEANYELAKKAGVKHMVFSHHDPMSSDKTLAEREKQCRREAEKLGFKLDFSHEGKAVEI